MRPKQTTLSAIAAATLLSSLIAAPLGTVLAEETAPAHTPAMPMMQGGKGGMGMMDPQMMMQRQEMMQQHMAKMEGYMANIEELLRELVELNKAK